SASNCGASTAYRGESTTTISVTAAPAVRGKAPSRTSLARSDCGLLVGAPSVVRAPPSNAPIDTTATPPTPPQGEIRPPACPPPNNPPALVESLTKTEATDPSTRYARPTRSSSTPIRYRRYKVNTDAEANTPRATSVGCAGNAY